MTYQYISASPSVPSDELEFRGTPTTATYPATSTSDNYPPPTSSISIANPGAQVGDLILIFVSCYAANYGSVDGFTAVPGPSGTVGDYDGLNAAAYYRIADGTEGNSFNGSGFYFDYHAVAICVVITDPPTPWYDPDPVSHVHDSGSAGTSVCALPSLSLSQPSNTLIGFFAYGENPVLSQPPAITPPPGWTTHASVTTGIISGEGTSFPTTAIFATKGGVPAGDTGDQTATSSGSGFAGGWMVGIPAPSPYGQISVAAPSGTSVTGGGYEVHAGFTITELRENAPSPDGSSWNFQAVVNDGNLSPGDVPVTVYAICGES